MEPRQAGKSFSQLSYISAGDVVSVTLSGFLGFRGPFEADPGAGMLLVVCGDQNQCTMLIEWVQPEAAIEIQADRMSLLRVFRNLVDNSLKYGGERLSRICIGYEETEDLHILAVSDNGKGLKEEDSERVFGLFQRPETSRGVEGAGLGLTIVKEIAKQHGGKVWLKPKTQKQTTFCISLSKRL